MDAYGELLEAAEAVVAAADDFERWYSDIFDELERLEAAIAKAKAKPQRDEESYFDRTEGQM